MKNLFKFLFSGSALLAISSMISRVMWMYRDHLLAIKFWAWIELDAYFAAFRIPDLIYGLLVFSSVSVAFMPYYIKVKNEKWLESSNILASKVLNLLTLIIWWITILIAIASPYIMDYYVPWFSEEWKKLTAEMMRIMLLSPIFFSISSVLISIHNASHKFNTQAFAPILYNWWILFWIFLSQKFWVQYLAYWVVIWAILQCIIQFPWVISDWFKWYKDFTITDEIKKMLKTAIPRILAIWLYQISLTVDTFIAATLSTWAISAISLASNIASLPLWMISVSISITAFVTLTKQSSDSKWFLDTLSINTKKTAFWLFPTLFWLYAISHQLIKFLFHYWKFSDNDAMLTENILALLLLAILFQWFLPLLNRAYFSRNETVKSLYFSIISMWANIFFSYLLSRYFWAIWIALWTVIWMGFYSVLLIIFTHKDFWKFFPFKSVLYYLFCSVVMMIILKIIWAYIAWIWYLFQIIILWITWCLIYFSMNIKYLHSLKSLYSK